MLKHVKMGKMTEAFTLIDILIHGKLSECEGTRVRGITVEGTEGLSLQLKTLESYFHGLSFEI